VIVARHSTYARAGAPDHFSAHPSFVLTASQTKGAEASFGVALVEPYHFEQVGLWLDPVRQIR
jgi:hypothetical protein